MARRGLETCAAGVLCLLLNHFALAQPVGPAQPSLKEQISLRLSQGAADDAVANIRRMLKTDTYPAAMGLLDGWLATLRQQGRHREAAELSLEALLLLPADNRLVQLMVHHRVQALLADGKKDEALAAAKGLYNVATMDFTAEALRHLGDCLAAARPQDVRRFRLQQAAGAMADPEARKADHGPSVLQSIKVDPAPYEAAIKAHPGNDYQGLMARGNLLLLADRPAEAWSLFEEAYRVQPDAPETVLPEATGNLAKCMKAVDGGIGRANAWVMSIRPKE